MEMVAEVMEEVMMVGVVRESAEVTEAAVT